MTYLNFIFIFLILIISFSYTEAGKLNFLLYLHSFVILYRVFVVDLLRRCFACRSRGEAGSCKDPFTFNATDVENERGVETVPCSSGWCGKIIESENDFKEGR